MHGQNCPPCLESWAADECLPCWDLPDFKCACLDLENPDHVALWNEAWKVASSYVFNETGQRFPGKCLTETVRPCVPVKCPPACRCYDCGRYNYLSIDEAFCYPVCEIESVVISPNPCLPDGDVWTEGDGFRLERVMGCLRLVIEDTSGCCGTFPRQDLCRPMGESCTWSITARTGCNPPPELLRGTAALACDIAQECINLGCGLPRSVSAASFNGVSVNYDDAKGKTIDLQMLKDVIGRYTPQPIEQFLNPCDPVTFHHVDGPRRDEEEPCEVPVPEVTDPHAPPVEPGTVSTTPNSLGIYTVSPVN